MKKYLVQYLVDGEWFEDLNTRYEIIKQIAMDRLADIYSAMIIYDISNGNVRKIDSYTDIIDEWEIQELTCCD